MNKNFFNKKYTILSPERVDAGISDIFVNFHGTKEELYVTVKPYEYAHDEVFNGHFYVKDYDLFIEYFLEYNLERLSKIFIPHKNAYFHKVNHDGIHSLCTVDSSVGLLSGYALSFFLNSDRTKLNEYVNLARHRIIIDHFSNVKKMIPTLL